MLQTGFIGFIVLMFPLLSISFKLAKINGKNAIVFFCFLIAILVHECFEVTLTQNMIICGLQMWLILGIGCSLEKRKN